MSEVVAERVRNEVWDALSLLAQRPQEELAVEDEETLDLLADEVTGSLDEEARKHPLLAQLMTGPPGPEVPFDERKNVIRLREAYAGAMDDSLTPQQYRAKMEPLFQLAAIAVELFKNPRIKREADVLPEDQIAIVNRLKTQVTRLKTAIDVMWRYPARPDKALLEGCFREAEDAMREIHAVQKDAARKVEEIDREEGCHAS